MNIRIPRLFARTDARDASKKSAKRLSVETLENRELLSATPWENLASDVPASAAISEPLTTTDAPVGLPATFDGGDFASQTANWTVDSLEDSATTPGTLRYAIANAQAGDVIDFDASLAGQTLTLTEGELVVDKPLTIDASALINAETGEFGVAIDATQNSRVFNLSGGTSDSPTTIVGVEILNGAVVDGNGAGVCSQGTTILRNCVVSGNQATTTITETAPKVYGGGIYSNGALTLDSVVFENNVAADDGGAVYVCHSGSLVATNCAFNDNAATFKEGDGGAICAEYASTIYLEDCSFYGNYAGDDGGAVYSMGTPKKVGSETTIVKSYATLVNCSFANNQVDQKAGASGGAFSAQYAEATLVDCSFAGNKAFVGGGVYAYTSTLTASGCDFSENEALAGTTNGTSCFGGGLMAHTTPTTLTDCSFVGNTAATHGGGLYANASAVQTLRCSFTGNEASQYGGGIANFSGDVALIDALVAGNKATTFGGGIYASGGVEKIVNTTIAGNESKTGGGIYARGGEATFDNAIVAQNVATTGGADVHQINDANLIARNVLSSFDNWTSGDRFLYDAEKPLFSDAENGDYTLAEGSQAIDQGVDEYAVDSQGVKLETDLNGDARFVGTVDLGAYEREKIDVVKIESVSLSAPNIKVGTTLVSTVRPYAATVAYEWYRVDDAGNATKIDGAAEKDYVVAVEDIGYFVKVVATGTGRYGGSAEKLTSSKAIPATTITVSLSAPNFQVGTEINATVQPYEATVDYQWYRVDGKGVETKIDGATGKKYTITFDDSDCYLKVVATGNGRYVGASASKTTSGKVIGYQKITSVSLSAPNMNVGTTVNATALPYQATCDYQWYRVDDAGNATKIDGATNKKYTFAAADVGYKLKAVATGYGFYAGSTAEKTTSGKVVGAKISSVSLSAPNFKVGTEINATVLPYSATVSYQWYRVDSYGNETKIQNATNKKYTIAADDCGCYLKVVATGNGAYAGSKAEKTTSGKAYGGLKIDSISLSSKLWNVGSTINATALPYDATADYQWYRVDGQGKETKIDGATNKKYEISDADVGFKLRVVATGNGLYEGSVANATAPQKVAEPQFVVSLSAPNLQTGTTINASVLPYTATVNYQWYRVDSNGQETKLENETGKTYTIVAEDDGCYLKAVATGVGDSAGYAAERQTSSTAVDPKITGVSLSAPNLQPGTTITATVLPTTATASFQWYRVDGAGKEAAVEGATDSTYLVSSEDSGYYLKVVATGTGIYKGTASCLTSGPLCVALDDGEDESASNAAWDEFEELFDDADEDFDELDDSFFGDFDVLKF